jgi:tetratricopeptide (TPR) repeat protein
MQESIALLEGINHPWHDSRSKMYLAQKAFFQGDVETGKRFANEVVADMQKAGAVLVATNLKSEIAHSLRRLGRLEEALSIYRETLAAYQDFGHRGAIAHQLECFAYIAIGQEQGERAVQLLSAANALRERVNSRRTPQEQMEYEKHIADLRAGLGEESFGRCWVDGKSMTMEQAIQLALD